MHGYDLRSRIAGIEIDIATLKRTNRNGRNDKDIRALEAARENYAKALLQATERDGNDGLEKDDSGMA